MTLLDRILSLEDPTVPIHAFMAGLAEYRRGHVTGPQLVTAFGLSPTEATALQTWLDNIAADTITAEEVHQVLLLGNSEEYYTKQMVKDRLGV